LNRPACLSPHRSSTVWYGYSSLRSNLLCGIPNLQAVLVDYIMICAQGFSSVKRRFEGLKRLHDMAVVSRDVKWSV
jgi:hypothetical protein